MAKAGWARQEMQRVAKDVKTLPRLVERSAKASTVSSAQQLARPKSRRAV